MDYIVKTPNFKYVLNVRETKYPIHKMRYSVGNTDNPCLEASVFMQDVDERIRHLIQEASIHKIEALQECLLNDVDETDASFGTELLYSIINIIKASHPYVKIISFQDASHIPCNREKGDMLDLLTYNIALHGNTWYEMKAGAYLESEKDQKKYDKEVAEYLALVPRIAMPFQKFYEKMLRNDFATAKITPHLTAIEKTYVASESFPAFFKYLNTLIDKSEKCRFYKDWLEAFIDSNITIKRDWKINIEGNPVLGNVLNVSKKRPMIRRKTRRIGRFLNKK